MGVLEVEAKIILDGCEELERVEERLRELGANLEEEVEERDIYYQHPCRDFAKTDEALRLRIAKGRAVVTYKSPKMGSGDVKARHEVNLEVGDAKAADELLSRLGFRRAAIVEKKRRYYRLGNVVVSLDNVSGLGCFIEVEYVGGGGDPVKAVEEAISLLGLAGKPRTTLSYLELLLAGRESGVKTP